MWSPKAPAALLGLVAFALSPMANAKPVAVLVGETSDLGAGSQLDTRQQCASPCGYQQQLCCQSGETCGVNDLKQAICIPAAGAASTDGSWSVFTTSTFIPAATPATGATCTETDQCAAGFYCVGGTCTPIAGPTPGVTPGVSTATGSPTATLPFSTPIPTGVNGTLVESNQGGGGLSGGAIAGIVIGVILGIILLLLICFYCCCKAALDTLLACFGLGKKRKTREETTYIEEHHHSGSAAAGGGRRWYGQAGSSRPSRPPKKSGGGMGNLLGVGAGLAGLAAVLGMKRKNDRRHDDKSTTVSGTSYYSYSDYTSSSSASSDDRRTRNTRQSSRRR